MNKKIALVALLLAMGFGTFGWAGRFGFGRCTDHTPPLDDPRWHRTPVSGQVAPPVTPSPATGNPAAAATPQPAPGTAAAMPRPYRPRPRRRPMQPPTYSSDPYGVASASGYLGDEPGETGTGPAAIPTPQNPVGKIYEEGKFAVKVGAEQHFGYHIGDQVVISVTVLAAPGVQFDFADLKKKILLAGGSDFELVKMRIEPGSQGGLNRWDIELTVQSMVDTALNPGIIFSMGFLYAVDTLPDGKGPDWKREVTPDFVISTSRTADGGTDMLEGDLDPQPERTSWLMWPALLLGATLLLWYPTVLGLRWQSRKNRSASIPDNQLAWMSFNKAISAGDGYGFEVAHYRDIAAALRRYYGVDAQTVDEVRQLLDNRAPADTPELQQRQDEERDLLDSALTKLDEVLTSNQPLGPDQHHELIGQLEKLVPKP